MIAAIDRPLPPWRLFAVAMAIVAGGAAYCLAYNAAAGSPESPLTATAWAVANLAPWFVAFEAEKALTAGRHLREPGFWSAAAVPLAAALAASLLLGGWLGTDTGSLDFRVLRRVPAAMLVLGLLIGGRMLRDRQAHRTDPAAARHDSVLPVDPRAIIRVNAAGNYVELHAGGRPRLHRLTMREAETLLAPHGFVRIHRSALVNRRRIARVLRGKLRDEVMMDDGSRLSVGGRYRSSLG